MTCLLLKYLYISTVSLSFLFAGIVQAGDVQKVRMWLAPDKTRLVFDLTGPVSHKIFPLKNPDRLVLDISGAEM